MRPYPLKIQIDTSGWLITSRDLSQLVTGAPRGITKRRAAFIAFDAFKAVAELLMEQGKPIPLASKLEDGEEFMPMTHNVSVKILIWNEIVQRKLKPAQIAQHLAKQVIPVKYPMTRFRNLDDPMSLDAIMAFGTLFGWSFDVVGFDRQLKPLQPI